MYPFTNELQELTKNFNNGNFGLWYNKYIPVSDRENYKASDEKGNTTEAIDYYKEQYSNTNCDILNRLLKEKHINQHLFLSCFSDNKFDKIFIVARTISPLITGLGETHPHETSMVFERNIGIPYIPASSIKGIVRFIHTLNGYLENRTTKRDNNGDEYYDDNNDEIIKYAYGSQDQRGHIIFMDAYPLTKPEMKVDVMTPHYVPYYTDSSGKTPPADYYNPVPLKFLTVKENTIFIFRALVDKKTDKDGIICKDGICNVIKKALTEEGIGAKTAIGYGRFEIINKDKKDHNDVLNWVNERKQEEEKRKKEIAEKIKKEQELQRFESMTEVDIAVYEISQTSNEQKLSEYYKNLSNFNSDDKIKIARALKDAYQRIGKWDGKLSDLSDKQKNKIKTIKNILGEAT